MMNMVLEGIHSPQVDLKEIPNHEQILDQHIAVWVVPHPFMSIIDVITIDRLDWAYKFPANKSGYEVVVGSSPHLKKHLFEYPVDFVYGVSMMKPGSTLHDCYTKALSHCERHQSSSVTILLKKVLDFIEQYYMEDMYLNRLSEEMGLHPNYISRIFSKHLGISFVRYLNEYRIQMAKTILINEPQTNVADIGRQVGYINSRQFFKVFKKVSGITPSDYRRRR